MPVQLPDISSDSGLLARLIIAECENPGYSDYTEADGQFSFRMMQATVYNRLQNNPGQFGAPGATKMTQIITASGQFDGFSMADDGTIILSDPVSSRIDAVMSKANAGAPGAYAQFVQDILTQVNGAVNDPLANVVSINGTAVQGGVYGWRTAGSTDPGGRFFAIPQQFGGLVLGNQFYTLLADSSPDITLPRSNVESAVFDSGSAFLRFLKSNRASNYLNGYVKQTESDDLLLFSYAPNELPWTPISVRTIGRVEYLGDEYLASGRCSRVRLLLK